MVVVGKHDAQERRSGLKGAKWAVGPVAERASESVVELPAAEPLAAGLVAGSIAAGLIAEWASELVAGLAAAEAFPAGGFAGAVVEAAAGVSVSVQEVAQEQVVVTVRSAAPQIVGGLVGNSRGFAAAPPFDTPTPLARSHLGQKRTAKANHWRPAQRCWMTGQH